MGKVTEDLKAAEAKLVEAAKDAVTGKEGEAAAALAEAGKDVKQAAADAVAEAKAGVAAVEAAVKAKVERAKGFFRTRFAYPLHDHTQNVTVTPEGVAAEHTDWIQGQIEAGTVVKVETDPAAAAPAAPAATAAPAAPAQGAK